MDSTAAEGHPVRYLPCWSANCINVCKLNCLGKRLPASSRNVLVGDTSPVPPVLILDDY